MIRSRHPSRNCLPAADTFTIHFNGGAPGGRTSPKVASRYFAGALFSDSRDRLKRIPGVVSAGTVSLPPLAGTGSRLSNIAVDGRGHLGGDSLASIAFVTPRYLQQLVVDPA